MPDKDLPATAVQSHQQHLHICNAAVPGDSQSNLLRNQVREQPMAAAQPVVRPCKHAVLPRTGATHYVQAEATAAGVASGKHPVGCVSA